MEVAFTAWAGRLANLYWFLRMCLAWDGAGRHKWYRRIAQEKKRLLATGVPYIEVHLVCRHLTNPRNPNASARLRAYYGQMRLALEP